MNLTEANNIKKSFPELYENGGHQPPTLSRGAVNWMRWLLIAGTFLFALLALLLPYKSNESLDLFLASWLVFSLSLSVYSHTRLRIHRDWVLTEGRVRKVSVYRFLRNDEIDQIHTLEYEFPLPSGEKFSGSYRLTSDPPAPFEEGEPITIAFNPKAPGHNIPVCMEKWVSWSNRSGIKALLKRD